MVHSSGLSSCDEMNGKWLQSLVCDSARVIAVFPGGLCRQFLFDMYEF